MTSSPVSSVPTQHLVCLAGGNEAASLQVLSPPSVSPTPLPQALFKQSLTPPDQFAITLKQLDLQAQRINELTQQLEKALWDFKELTTQAHQQSYGMRQYPEYSTLPQPICEYQDVTLPHVYTTPQGHFKLTPRSLDLRQAEREAHFLAIALRQRQNRLHPTKSTPPANFG